MGNYINNIKDDREIEYSLYDRRLSVGGHDTSLYLDSQYTSLNNYAGAKGWYLKSWVPVSGTTDTFYVELVNDAAGTTADSNLFEENDILSARATFSANYALTVLEIVDPVTCKLKVKYTEYFNIIFDNASQQGQDTWSPASHLYTDQVKGYIWNPEKPSIGVVPIGVGALTIGQGNKANELGSLSIGYINEVDGRYAFAAGLDNKVAYSSAAIGEANEVYGYCSLAVGTSNTLRNWRTSAFGQSNSMSAKNGFVSGRGNWVTKNAHEGINVRGVFAKLQNNSTYIDIVGGGDDPQNQKNAYALTPDGELRLHGDVYVRCDDDSNNGVNISGEYEVVKINGQNEYVFPSGISDKEFTIPAGKHCIMVYVYIPRKPKVGDEYPAENYRIYANQITTTNETGAYFNWAKGYNNNQSVITAVAKFDCRHGILDAEGAFFGGLSAWGNKTTYTGYSKSPVQMSSITKIFLRNFTGSSSQEITAGTKIKIYAY